MDCFSVSIALKDLGLTNASGYTIFEVFENAKMGMFKPNDKVTVKVNPTGVFFGRATPA